METLALRYRPSAFSDLVGQRAVNVILRQMVTLHKVPTALLFSGCRGTGKTTTARILAAALNCDSPPDPCGHCVSCKSVQAGTSLDLIEIDAASNGLVDDIRKLCTRVLYSVGGRRRVVVIDEAHSVSGAGFNALLKTLEEPPPDTIFVLATTEPHRIPDTVQSRTMPFVFGRIPVEDITARLAHIASREQLTVEDELLQLIAERADGAMRDAIMALDQMTRAGVTTVAQYAELMGDPDSGPRLLHTIASGTYADTCDTMRDILSRTGDPNEVSDALVRALSDVLVLHSAGRLHYQGHALLTRQELARVIDARTAVAGLSVLWDLRTKLRAMDDPRTSLELAIAMLTAKLARPSASAVAPTQTARKLTLAEMATL